MATLCDVTCGAASVPPVRYDADCSVESRKIGAEHFFLVKCDAEINITDPIAVDAAILAGDIVISPRGKLTTTRGDQDIIEDAFGCGDDIVLNRKKVINYETYQAKCDDVTDDTYWADVNDNINSYRIGYVDCCGKIFYDVGAANPGFKINLQETFEFVDGENGYGIWQGSFEIETTQSIIPLYDLAVVTALGVSINVS